ncbi:hypothetical protein [Runella slithyformis]|uniref:Uncharacterized protein n=1 Tax=Runella slithyformis (strain ATCC 29530 / DSM 19594 / LMG 11500 / NCIMB 11436 / LSU 4) TaxID=761193 RepID=A0A7U3ZN67_RUNSL|nr:hypothetical protein [Runella slithyformis]AEI50305.1 hypothetical protein Runsl_3952 [Runella slithyformis DSM 19594]
MSLIPIKPTIEFQPSGLNVELIHKQLIWQGIHVCTESIGIITGKEYLCDLPVNQAKITPFYYEKNQQKFTNPEAEKYRWFTESLVNIIKKPIPDFIEINIEKLKQYDDVVIVMALDNLYGHSLNWLLSAQSLLDDHEERGIIVIIQPFLRWLVPEGVSEIWTVKLPMSCASNYYPSLDQQIKEEIKRFNKVWLFGNMPQPRHIDIERFTRVKPYAFDSLTPRITFIWREDVNRLWVKNWYVYGFAKIFRIQKLFLPLHYLRTLYFFYSLRRKCKNLPLRYTLTGLGRWGRFPIFIEDQRVLAFNDKVEREVCEIYAESHLVVGIHGSSMILPSAHAGMTVSLMPHKRWGNFAQDLLMNENDDMMAIFQKRILPIRICIDEITDICYQMLTFRDGFITRFINKGH